MLERETVLTWKQACDEYDKWNRAVYDYFVKSVSLGGQVFLSVDEESLDRIGKSFGKTHKDFLDVMQIRSRSR
jgi:hypothetical protein